MRRIVFKNVKNLRDLGGYQTKDNKYSTKIISILSSIMFSNKINKKYNNNKPS